MGGQLAAGEPLIEQALAEKFGVSRTPVREALHRLAQAGLAERGTRRAYFVREMTPEDLAELFEATGEIESALAALAAKRMSEIERRQLMAIVESGDARRYTPISTGSFTRLSRSVPETRHLPLLWTS